MYKIYKKEKCNYMLKKIHIKNIGSIKKCEIDFKKARYSYKKENLIGRLVNPIAIYGYNGSGKSSFFDAIQMLISLMIDPINSLTPFVPNLFFSNKGFVTDEKWDYSCSAIELFFEIDGDNYEYMIMTNAHKSMISDEFLIVNGIPIFEHKNVLSGDVELINKQKEHEFSLIPELRKRASKNLEDKYVQKAYEFILSLAVIASDGINRGIKSGYYLNTNIYELQAEYSPKIKECLKDMGYLQAFTIQQSKNANLIMQRNRIFAYELKLEDGNFKGTLPVNFISKGMLEMHVLLSFVLTMPKNGVLFVDELEENLHPLAIKSFLKIIQEKQVQLVFSSHNTSILQYLRPDQIYFATWHKGYSKYLRLSDIYSNIREVNNIEKMYLSNIFDEVIEEGE